MAIDEGHPLFGAHLRAQRADRHLSEVDHLLRKFGEDCASFVLPDDPHGDQFRLTTTGPLPLELPLAVSDSIHNLRAALDYVVYELAILDSGAPKSGTQFPIEDVKNDPTGKRGFDANAKRLCPGINNKHLDMIEALQPYRGVAWTGNLRRLSNPDKHRTLTVLNAAGYFTITVLREGSGALRMKTTGTREHLDCKVEAHQAVVVDLPAGLVPIATTLREIEARVFGVVEMFASEF